MYSGMLKASSYSVNVHDFSCFDRHAKNQTLGITNKQQYQQYLLPWQLFKAIHERVIAEMFKNKPDIKAEQHYQ